MILHILLTIKVDNEVLTCDWLRINSFKGYFTCLLLTLNIWKYFCFNGMDLYMIGIKEDFVIYGIIKTMF